MHLLASRNFYDCGQAVISMAGGLILLLDFSHGNYA